jgi:undecaprenyl-phosphate 4-deoxy-4-formamido-L-arabinose transferase
MIYVKIYYGVPVQGYTSLATIILFTSSMMMMSMGIVGEYISRIFMSLNNKPQYSIEKKI